MEVGLPERRVSRARRRDVDGPTHAKRSRRRPAPCPSPARARCRSAPRSRRERARPDWLEEARAGLDGRRASTSPTRRPAAASWSPVSREWTRIGRSLAADVRFDDATVSRRHALIVNQADGVRVLDDRSLNGVYVNGRRVEWSPLTDGDEIVDRPPHASTSWTPPPSAPAQSPPAARRRVATGSPTVAIVPRPWPRRSRSCRSRAARARPRPSAPWPTCSGASASTCSPSTSTRRATCRTTSTSRRTPRRRSPTCSRGDAKAKEAAHDGIIPATPILAEVERVAVGQDGPRARAAQGAQGRRARATT